MTFGLPIATATLWKVAAVLGGLTVVAYILKMRRRRFQVPFSTLWQRVLREKETTTLWKHLRRILSLLLLLAILGLLLFAVLDPKLGRADDDGKSVVVIIDASASMKTRDAGPDGTRTRMEEARRRTRDLLSAMGGGDQAMLVKMDGQTTPLTRFDTDMPMLRKAVDGIEASDTPADLRRALQAASDALHDQQNRMIVLIGDGAYSEEVLDSVVWEPLEAAAGGTEDGDSFSDERLAAIDLSGIDVRYEPIGATAQNVGIVAFNVRRYIANKMSYEVFIEVQNFGTEPARRKLVLYNGGLAVDVKQLALQPGERLRKIYPEISGGDDHRLRATIEPLDEEGNTIANTDAFPLDDRAYALLPKRKRQHVLLVTEDNLYLEGAMLVYENIEVDKLLPAEYEASIGDPQFPDFDAVVYDDYTPEALPDESTHLLYFNPESEGSPFPIRRTLTAPRITELADHPVMRWLEFSDVNFDESSVFRVDRDEGEVVLARSIRAPIIAAKRDGRRKIVAAGFSLEGTDLMLRVAFPLLLVNTLDWFAGDDSDLITTYETGHRFQVPMDGAFGVSEASVHTPGGGTTRAPLVDGRATFYGHSIGVHALTAKEDGQVLAEIELAANLANPTESDIAPSDELILGGQSLEQPETFETTHRRSIWTYLALAVLLLLCVEWVTYNRRITV